MRISTSTIYDSNVASMGQQQGRLLQIQQQVASGNRLLNASIDPVATARAMELTQQAAINTQQTTNRNSAKDPLAISDSTLNSVTMLLQDVRTSAVAAGNSTLTNADRANMAINLKGRLQELVGLANVKDGTGNSLYGGYQSSTTPFVATAPSGVVAYTGDDGQRLVQAGSGRQLPVTDSGANVFMRIKNGNGAFSTQPSATNTGSGIISTGSVTNLAALTGNNYSVNFTVTAAVPPVTTYSVTNTTTATPVAGMTNQPFVGGQNISFDGQQFTISGAPANGDSFAVAPSSNQSVFATISNLITTLQTPASGANLSNGLMNGIANIDNAINNISGVRASIGSRMNELDALQSTGDSMDLQLKTSLSALQDTDYTQAMTALTQQTVSLQAAQKSFVQVSSLTMFTYM